MRIFVVPREGTPMAFSILNPMYDDGGGVAYTVSILRHGHGAWPVYLVYRTLRRFGDPIYHFHGLSFHKGRYRASDVPAYTAVKGPIGLLPLFASARVSRMV